MTRISGDFAPHCGVNHLPNGDNTAATVAARPSRVAVGFNPPVPESASGVASRRDATPDADGCQWVHDGPPANNHAERSLRPMVIFRKVCLCTRSPTGSDNSSIFGSLTQTAALHGSHPLEMFRALFRSSAAAQDVIFGHPVEASRAS